MCNLIKASFQSKANYALALLSEALAPLLRLAARVRTGSAPSRGAWRRGVLLGADHIGDVLYRTGALPALHHSLPACIWSWPLSAPADELAAADPHVRGGSVRLSVEIARLSFIALVRLLKAGRYDVALCYDTGGYGRLLFAAVLAGIPARVGYVHKGFSGLVTDPVAIRYPQPFPCYFRDLASQLAEEPLSGEPPLPLVHPMLGDEAAAGAFWRTQGWDRPGSPPVLACAFFTRQRQGLFPLAAFAEVVRSIQRERPVALLFLGAQKDRPVFEAFLRQESLEGTLLTGDLGLRAVYCLLRKCAAAWVADSGIRHLANAAGIPVVFPRNPSFLANEAGVYRPAETDVSTTEGIDIALASCTLLQYLRPPSTP